MQKQLAEKFTYTNHSSGPSTTNSSLFPQAQTHVVRDMLTQIMNDQIFMKEQLLRLNAASSSSSSLSSSSHAASESSIAIIDVNNELSNEFVDNYGLGPAVKVKAAKKKREWSEGSLSLLAALKNEKNTIDQARISKSNIPIIAFPTSVCFHPISTVE